jgi:hypothetical protein
MEDYKDSPEAQAIIKAPQTQELLDVSQVDREIREIQTANVEVCYAKKEG